MGHDQKDTQDTDLLHALLSQTPEPHENTPKPTKQIDAGGSTTKENRQRRQWTTRDAALMGFIGVVVGSILTGVLSNSRLVDVILDQWNTHTRVIPASPRYSGVAEIETGAFTPLGEQTGVYGPGETRQEQETRVLLSFDLRDIPKDSSILDAELVLPCQATGQPQHLGRLTIQPTYGIYDPRDMEEPPGIFLTSDGLFVRLDAGVWSYDSVARCTEGIPLAYNPNSLVDRISELYWEVDLQFIIFFDTFVPTQNDHQDALLLEPEPELHLQYTTRP